MRILHVGKHGSGGNDDEGAITHALTQLGHEVACVCEDGVAGPAAAAASALQFDKWADLVLFHKWHDVETLKKLKTPKVFFYFDLVDFPDPTLRGRCDARMAWMRDVMPLVDLGFCTDGDWIARHPEKLVWLTQGADERIMGPGRPELASHQCDILFTGGRNGGTVRASFVDEMKERYGDRFLHVPAGTHGRALANLIAGAKIVVAPDGPITQKYWSNRLYLALGFGGFLIHPWCNWLTDYQYRDNVDLVLYETRDYLHELIDHFMVRPQSRARIAQTGYETTQLEHTYRHRCEQLIRTVKERLHV